MVTKNRAVGGQFAAPDMLPSLRDVTPAPFVLQVSA
jgi:hypothetical protein